MNVRDLYPDSDGDSLSDYTPILEALGEVVVRVNERDCSGSTWVLLRRDAEWGYLCFGWGSCSGCDALQGCSSFDDAQVLADTIESQVMWRSCAEMMKWFASHDWGGDWHADNDDVARFIEQAKAALAAAAAGPKS